MGPGKKEDIRTSRLLVYRPLIAPSLARASLLFILGIQRSI